ncbi:NAC domain-containing protein 100 [Linum perenne]
MKIPGAPAGYRFRPSDEQIVTYLHDKVTGNALPCNMILERDLYSDDEAWKSLFSETWESELYFFTKLRKSKKKGSGIGKRVDRTVGTKGTWRASSKGDDPIVLNNGVQGSKRTFAYREKEKSAKEGLGFVMTEYRLDRVNPQASEYEYVICRLRKIEKKSSDEGVIALIELMSLG